MMLITLEEAKEHLRVDTNRENSLIESYIKASSSSIYQYIKDEIYSDKEEKIIREDVKTACKLFVGDLYQYRDSENSSFNNSNFGQLPNFVVSLLYCYRKKF